MDPISNTLAIIKNASMVEKETCSFPASKILFAISLILKREGFIKDFKKEGRAGKHEQIKISLHYPNGQPAIGEIKRISHLGRRMYIGHRDIKIPKYGIVILSTPQGIMTSKDAKKANIGGEVICEIR